MISFYLKCVVCIAKKKKSCKRINIDDEKKRMGVDWLMVSYLFIEIKIKIMSGFDIRFELIL